MSRLFSPKLWLTCGFIISLVVAFGFYQAKQLVVKPIQPSEESLIVKKGASVGLIAAELERRGVIDKALHLKLVAKQAGNANQLKAGEYDISRPQSLGELWRSLVKGDVVSYKVVFLEGWDFKTIRAHLASIDNISHDSESLSAKQIMDQLGAKGVHPEGQFAPNTFLYQKGASDLSLLKQSYNLQQKTLDEQWQKRTKSEHIKSKYEALILASIIEKETSKAVERPEISGVFHNRLKIGMRLQTDPTVIYGMGDQYKGNIKRIHLRTDTPYNTYTRYGLPPTPIAMPSEAAINAALNPKQTKAFYFVGKGDGSHYFSKTLPEHNRAVAKYQLGQ